MITTATWQEMLKENLAGRVVVTSELGISFRGTIDRAKTNGDFLYIYPKAWFRLYGDWELWETEKAKELGHPEPVVVRISGENTEAPEVNEETGEIHFCIPFKGDVWIRYHDCIIQSSDDPSICEDGCTVSDLVYLKDSGNWVIRTTLVFYDNKMRNQNIDLHVRHCPECGEKLPKF